MDLKKKVASCQAFRSARYYTVAAVSAKHPAWRKEVEQVESQEAASCLVKTKRKGKWKMKKGRREQRGGRETIQHTLPALSGTEWV